jgi:hypothetical protein
MLARQKSLTPLRGYFIHFFAIYNRFTPSELFARNISYVTKLGEGILHHGRWKMLFLHWQQILGSCCLGTLALWVMSAFAHFHSKRLPAGHEDKKSFHPYAWLAMPFTLPFFLVSAIFSAILYAALFGLLLIVFALSLLLLRKPFLFKWIKETALTVGNFLLKINTRLLRAILPMPVPAQ